ncbi:ETV1 [Mytilus coruscus]|uniref:ETV1 n=1 Tax=Mytilus coruscus TaxID=42192 RepID=A0A6J8AY10_MYTCO|nr:ETV1 [Mytilus coruscus]
MNIQGNNQVVSLQVYTQEQGNSQVIDKKNRSPETAENKLADSGIDNKKRRERGSELLQVSDELFQDLSQMQETWLTEASQTEEREQYVPGCNTGIKGNNYVNPYLKIKTEPKTSTCCGPAIPNSLQKVNSTSKYDYGERRYLTGSDHTPSSPSGSVCSSSSGKESSSLSPCCKDVSQYSNGTDSSCTYMNRSPERVPRPSSAPQKGYFSPDPQTNYCRLMSTTYAHHFFKQELYDRSYDISRNHGYSQLPSSQTPTVKQEPREFTFDNGFPCPYDNPMRFFCHDSADSSYLERFREKHRERFEVHKTTPWPKEYNCPQNNTMAKGIQMSTKQHHGQSKTTVHKTTPWPKENNCPQNNTMAKVKQLSTKQHHGQRNTTVHKTTPWPKEYNCPQNNPMANGKQLSTKQHHGQRKTTVHKTTPWPKENNCPQNNTMAKVSTKQHHGQRKQLSTKNTMAKGIQLSTKTTHGQRKTTVHKTTPWPKENNCPQNNTMAKVSTKQHHGQRKTIVHKTTPWPKEYNCPQNNTMAKGKQLSTKQHHGQRKTTVHKTTPWPKEYNCPQNNTMAKGKQLSTKQHHGQSKTTVHKTTPWPKENNCPQSNTMAKGKQLSTKQHHGQSKTTVHKTTPWPK